jgi:hypothetical protein
MSKCREEFEKQTGVKHWETWVLSWAASKEHDIELCSGLVNHLSESAEICYRKKDVDGSVVRTYGADVLKQLIDLLKSSKG